MMAAEPKPSGPTPGDQRYSGKVMRGNARVSSEEGRAAKTSVIQSCNMVDEAEREEVMVAEEKYVEVVLDSGSIDHIANPDHLPRDTSVVQTVESRNRQFVNASGKTIENYGEAQVVLADEENNTKVGCKLQVADVTRLLHATGPICDTKKEVLYTSTQAVVVSEGTFSKLLKDAKILARYERKGKRLYTARLKISAARQARPGTTGNPNDKDFTRQGSKR